MKSGTVKWFNESKGFGRITADDGGEEIHVHFSDIVGKGYRTLYEGQRVNFEIAQDDQGRTEAVKVSVIGEAVATGQEQRRNAESRERQSAQQSSSASTGDYFLNPYNFVRFVTARKEKRSLTGFAAAFQTTHSVPSKSDTALLGRCAPPPHDRYLGLTGKIICELEAVTPLFVSDSENVNPDKPVKGHNSYDFFKLNGKHALPATSLRGMIRSVLRRRRIRV